MVDVVALVATVVVMVMRRRRDAGGVVVSKKVIDNLFYSVKVRLSITFFYSVSRGTNFVDVCNGRIFVR